MSPSRFPQRNSRHGEPELGKLGRDVTPEQVLDTLEAMQQQATEKAQTDEP